MGLTHDHRASVSTAAPTGPAPTGHDPNTEADQGEGYLFDGRDLPPELVGEIRAWQRTLAAQIDSGAYPRDR